MGFLGLVAILDEHEIQIEHHVGDVSCEGVVSIHRRQLARD